MDAIIQEAEERAQRFLLYLRYENNEFDAMFQVIKAIKKSCQTEIAIQRCEDYIPCDDIIIISLFTHCNKNNGTIKKPVNFTFQFKQM